MRPLVLLALLMSGCGYYSFTGASIPAELNTIAIPLAEMAAPSPVTTLSDDLTQLLTDRFVRQTRLQLQEDEAVADAVLEARIEGYRNEPVSVSGDDRATRNRVTITTQILYRAREASEPLLARSFTAFADYDPLTEGLDGETRAAREALERIAEDVFTAATSNW